MLSNKIKVLVVDDSELIRTLLADVLNADRDIDVVGVAKNGLEAVEKSHSLRPDVITLDLIMPDYDGHYALKRIMSERPVPVITVSALTQFGARETMEALKSGAFDFYGKPEGHFHTNIKQIARELSVKIKVASRIDIKTLFADRPPAVQDSLVKIKSPISIDGPFLVVVIGGSTGGILAIEKIVSALESDFRAAVLIIQHLPKIFTETFAAQLDKLTPLVVKEAAAGDRIIPGKIYVAPGGSNLVISSKSKASDELTEVRRDMNHKIAIELSEESNDEIHPSIDLAMESAAKRFKKNTVGVILSGMGTDGVRGIMAIKSAGGTTIAQDEASCVVYGMPRAAVEYGAVTNVLPLTTMSAFLNEVVKRKHARV